MNKTGVLFEIIWFVMGGLLLIMGIQQSIDTGIEENWHLLLFALLALLMYYRRRKIRMDNK